MDPVLTPKEIADYYYLMHSPEDAVGNEKSIEVNYYHLMKKWWEETTLGKEMGLVAYTAPHNVDGLITIKTLTSTKSILVESKLNRDYRKKKDRNFVLCQVISYLHTFLQRDELVPAVTVLLAREGIAVFDTMDLLPLTRVEGVKWDEGASAMGLDKTLFKAVLATDPRHTFFPCQGEGLVKSFEHITTLLAATPFQEVKKRAYLTEEVMKTDPALASRLVEELVKKWEGSYAFSEGENKWYCYRPETGQWTVTLTSVIDRRIAHEVFLKEEELSPLDRYLVHSSLFLQGVRRELELRLPWRKSTPPEQAQVEVWFSETFLADGTTLMSYVTFDDLLHSFNDYLVARGNRPVSARYLASEFTNHRVFLQNKLAYKKNMAPIKGSYRSPYYTIDFPQGKPTKEKFNYVLGLAFRS